MQFPNSAKSAFVLMPFRDETIDLYRLGIKQPLEERGYLCSRIDEEYFSGPIREQILLRIDHSDLIIADISDSNLNVYYEIGYAHGAGKEPVLLARKGSALPFDIASLRCILYGNLTSLQALLKEQLEAIEIAAARQPSFERQAALLRPESQAVLLFLLEEAAPQPAAACADVARGIFAVMNDLRFAGYITFKGQLKPATEITLTAAGRRAAELFVQSRP